MRGHRGASISRVLFIGAPIDGPARLPPHPHAKPRKHKAAPHQHSDYRYRASNKTQAEAKMLAAGYNKEYLPIEGLDAFRKATVDLLLGADHPAIKEVGV